MNRKTMPVRTAIQAVLTVPEVPMGMPADTVQAALRKCQWIRFWQHFRAFQWFRFSEKTDPYDVDDYDDPDDFAEEWAEDFGDGDYDDGYDDAYDYWEEEYDD